MFCTIVYIKHKKAKHSLIALLFDNLLLLSVLHDLNLVEYVWVLIFGYRDLWWTIFIFTVFRLYLFISLKKNLNINTVIDNINRFLLVASVMLNLKIYIAFHILSTHIKRSMCQFTAVFCIGFFLLWANESRLRLSGVLMSVSVSLCGVHTPTRGGWQEMVVAYHTLRVLLFFNLSPLSFSLCFSLPHLNFSQLWHVKAFPPILTTKLILQQVFGGIVLFWGSSTDTTV